ncbi:hypothetical protein CONCODRAFT_8620 [Conidiobolus coronatus NRRL 28638]|uniref:Phosphatidylglycerol/phosphatidylinositol transfer protein n=1 Tax=Conidiobolus coronatus (strain ATCC 28846 / CBS 209.66 / NRRL 28638) TaxID=796925 RepID=A0A137P1U8_CONC2|nr:hypothetical protein CONCODRAFT_8620 [Conidiobolus coronatus NRRL 28638]|eukprot:KXN69036.1 hypothetical protein CONCODRAFT_8620 [Conidiobolus coronatus NRRL 28638]
MQLLAFLPLIATALAQSCSPVFQNKVFNCGTPSDLLQVSSVNLAPETPKRGDTIVLTVNGQLSADITAGSVTYSAEYKGQVVKQVTKDLCESGKCPFKAGPNTLTKEFAIPAAIPAGDYVINITTKTANGVAVSHLRGNVNLQ